jgi:diguanylate cyclase (GGDEF)-like protein
VLEREFRLRLGEGFAGWIALHAEGAVVANSLDDDRVVHLVATPSREESLVGAPLLHEGRVQGVITLSRLGTNQFDENDLRLLEIIAAQTALALDRVQLYAELRAQAITDDLTKLHNRRYLSERFKEERARALRNQHTLAVIMLDIDSFKRVNDHYGHDAGDAVLQDLAMVTRAVVRAEDVVARYGGEEFCVLLPEVSMEEAEGVAERLRAVVERRRLPDAAGVRNVTVSVGVAYLATDDSATDVFTRADEAMYEAKRAGGNGVCIWDGSSFRLACPDDSRAVEYVPRLS